MDTDKAEEYVKALYSVFQMVYKKAEYQRDQRLKIISLCIFNYTKFFAKEHNIVLPSNTSVSDQIHLRVIFEYINENAIQLYDFAKISLEDVNVNDNKDLERFVLSHIYYLTQK